MTALDDLPNVDSFFGIDLKTGSIIIAAISVVHPMAYGCSLFLPVSYLLVTIWILVALYFAASVALFFGLVQDDVLLCSIWLWYALIFVGLMMMLMILLALVFTSRKQINRAIVVILGMLWYILSVYFIIVVNSHRKKLQNSSRTYDIMNEMIPDMATNEYTTTYVESYKSTDVALSDVPNSVLNVSLSTARSILPLIRATRSQIDMD